jgi:Glycosyl hydrolase family 92 N-terminal domain
MVQLGPDTDNSRWDACSGYHKEDATLLGFSHAHLSGTGIGDMLDVLVVPNRGPLKLAPGTLEKPEGSYRQRYSEEHAEPGYYRVRLESGVRAELTVTERTGQHRYTFPVGPGHILIDFAHAIIDSWDKGRLVEDAVLALSADGLLTGSRKVNRWAKGRHIHFAMRLSRTPDRVQFFGDDDAPAAAGGGRHRRQAAEGRLVLRRCRCGADPDQHRHFRSGRGRRQGRAGRRSTGMGVRCHPIGGSAALGTPALRRWQLVEGLGPDPAGQRPHAPHPGARQWCRPALCPIGDVERQTLDAQPDRPRRSGRWWRIGIYHGIQTLELRRREGGSTAVVRTHAALIAEAHGALSLGETIA